MNQTEEQIVEIAHNCQTVAVIGMTDGSKPGRESYDIPRMLQARGVKIIPVNPRIAEALGEKSLASVADLDQVPDVYDIFRRVDAIAGIADELIALPDSSRKAVVWMQSGISHPESEQRLEAAGFRVVSDKCLGTYVALSGR